MPRKIGPKSNLDSFRKDAKRWLKELRAGRVAAQARLAQAWPRAPQTPALRDIQHALALEYGFTNWIGLKAALAALALDRQSNQERAETVLRHAWGGDLVAATRIVRRFPAIARESLHLAVLCGDLGEVERHLAADPTAALARAGTLAWQPLQYLAYGRLPDSGNGLAIARALLDSGADPNASFDDGWGNAFTVLTGVIGAGEEPQPPHPDAEALVSLLIDRGADPFDMQAFYNTSLAGDDVHWLAFLYGRSVARGDLARWITAPQDKAIGGNQPVSIIDYLLGNAVNFNQLVRATWLMDHGGDPNGVNSYSGKRHYVVAQLAGFREMAELLLSRGAEPVPLTGQVAFQASCMQLDRDKARRLISDDPTCLADPAPLIHAAAQDRVDVIELLLDLGMPVDLARDDAMRALHAAAQHGRIAAAAALIRAGADIGARGSRHQATPLDFAVHGNDTAMIDLLAPLSRDVFGLARAGRVERLAELLASDPTLAIATSADGPHPLFALPDDEEAAVAVTSVLLVHGADPNQCDSQGNTPAQAARKRGLDDVADLLEGL